MVPPQVAYGKRNTGQSPHPRKKINVQRNTREHVESRNATYAKEENHVSTKINNMVEDGEEVDSEDN
tara:strand:- start:414 stop:614 length:201 start_codon:yes stop_codon:yes gene_type:complete